MASCHVRIGLPLGGCVAEVAPSIDDLLRRTAADPQLQPAASDRVRRARILGHVERVFITHIDDRCADLDFLCTRADGCEERKWGAELAREVMHAEVGAVGAQFFGRYSEIDRLEQRIACGPYA